jgi:hypothetical protein
MTRPTTTATFLSKIALASMGLAIVIGGFVLREMANRSEGDPTVAGIGLHDLGSWALLVGAGWMIITLIGWAFAPAAWDSVAPYIVAIMLAFGILGNIILDAAVRLAGLESIIDPSDGLPWRIALSIGCLAIGATQWMVSSTLAKTENVIPGAVGRLRLSSVAVLLLGSIAAWTSPTALVGFLTMAAMIYIAIELMPRS